MFAIRDVRSLITETEEEGTGLKKSVGAVHLTAIGVGAIIGTGIFVVIGEGSGIAGPAVILSFVLAAVACTFSALSYAELASSIPISGSAYTYTYATLGEIVAWIIGWDLILEYGVSVAAIAVGWGGNLNLFLDVTFGFKLPEAIATSPEDGGIINLPAVIVVLAIMVFTATVKVVQEYERGVVFRLGRFVGARGPGLILLMPAIERMVKVDLRVVTMDVPSQEVITSDNVTVKVNAVVYFQVLDPGAAVTKVLDFGRATSLIAQTTLRSV